MYNMLHSQHTTHKTPLLLLRWWYRPEYEAVTTAGDWECVGGWTSPCPSL